MAELKFDDLAPIMDQKGDYADVITAGREGGLGDRKVHNARANMATAIAAHGKDDTLARAALIIAYAASRTGIAYKDVAAAFPKGAEKSDELKKAFTTGRKYYNRALSDAGLVSEGPGAGNDNAGTGDANRDTVTEPATPTVKNGQELGEYFLGQAVALKTTAQRAHESSPDDASIKALLDAATKFEQQVIGVTSKH